MQSRYQGRYQPRTASKYAGRGPFALGEGVGVRLPGNGIATTAGDSRSAQLIQSSTSWSHNGAGQHYASVLSRGRLRLPFANVFGTSGHTPAQVRAGSYVSAKATTAKILFLLCGVNQGASLEVDLAEITLMVQDWVASASDRVVIVYDEMPVGITNATYNSTWKTRHAALRDGIRALSSPANGIYVYGSWRIATGGDDSDTALSGFYMPDGLHPIAKGSFLLGKSLATGYVTTLTPTFDPYAGLTFAPGVALDGQNFLGATGNALSVASLAASGVVSSRMVVDGATTWAELTINGTGPQLNPNYAGLPVGITPGTTIVSAIAIVKLHAGLTGLRTVQLTPIKQSAGNLAAAARLDMQNRGSAFDDGPIPVTEDTYLYLRTPPAVVDAAATQARFQIFPISDYVGGVAQTISGLVSVAYTGLVIEG